MAAVGKQDVAGSDRASCSVSSEARGSSISRNSGEASISSCRPYRRQVGLVSSRILPARSAIGRTTLAGTVAGIEGDDDGPLAGVSIDLNGHGHLFALATREAIDELKLHPGDRVFALVSED